MQLAKVKHSEPITAYEEVSPPWLTRRFRIAHNPPADH